MRSNASKQRSRTELPSYYEAVADDVLCQCQPKAGIWVDLGSGTGGLGLALARRTAGCVVLVDPDVGALGKALIKASQSAPDGRVLCLAGAAEALPLIDASVDLIVSLGAIFFWRDAVKGLRESLRVLRPGGCGRVGGGLRRPYPGWEEDESTGGQIEAARKKGPGALDRFWERTNPAKMLQLASDADISNCNFVRDGLRGWLLFHKPEVG